MLLEEIEVIPYSLPFREPYVTARGELRERRLRLVRIRGEGVEGLGETASYDGKTWTRRYAELGLDVTRAVTDDDLAIAMAYLPIWIADPGHYARYFKVSSPGAHKVALSRTVRGKDQVVLQLDTPFPAANPAATRMMAEGMEGRGVQGPSSSRWAWRVT